MELNDKPTIFLLDKVLFIDEIAFIVDVIGLFIDMAIQDGESPRAPVCVPRFEPVKECGSESKPVAIPGWNALVEPKGGAMPFKMGRTSRMSPVAVITATLPGTETADSAFTLTRGST